MSEASGERACGPAPITTLAGEIAWWTKAAFATQSDAALIAFGVATGLKLARADYGAAE